MWAVWAVCEQFGEWNTKYKNIKTISKLRNNCSNCSRLLTGIMWPFGNMRRSAKLFSSLFFLLAGQFNETVPVRFELTIYRLTADCHTRFGHRTLCSFFYLLFNLQYQWSMWFKTVGLPSNQWFFDSGKNEFSNS